MYDLLIQNAMIADGSGQPAYRGEVACLDGKLHLLPAGSDVPAAETIDATGRWLAPGFIDCHSHGDVPLGMEFSTYAKVSQGITTEIGGQCGSSMFPVNPQRLRSLQSKLQLLRDDFPPEMAHFQRFTDYLAYVKTLALTTNICFLMGHAALRIAAMGFDNRCPTDGELDHMKALLRDAMEHGCLGMSAGQTYVPSVYADTDELAELATVVAQYGGVYTAHIRNESNHLLDSIRETIEVGRRSGCHVHISHLKAMGKSNWGQSTEARRLIAEANAAGIRVTADQYPYTASMTNLNATIPPKYFTEGLSGMVAHLKNPDTAALIRSEILNGTVDFENQWRNRGGPDGIFVARAAKTPECEGMTLAESAEKFGKDPMDWLFEILIRNGGVASAIYFCMDEWDVENIIKDPNVVVGTDGIPLQGGGRAHPRAFGTFPRAFRVFAREKGLLSMEAMVRKMTGLTADIMQLGTKGYIREGYDADLVLFDPETMRDAANYMDSNAPTEGIDRVMIAGQTVLQNQKLTGITPGQILLHRH